MAIQVTWIEPGGVREDLSLGELCLRSNEPLTALSTAAAGVSGVIQRLRLQGVPEGAPRFITNARVHVMAAIYNYKYANA